MHRRLHPATPESDDDGGPPGHRPRGEAPAAFDLPWPPPATNEGIGTFLVRVYGYDDAEADYTLTVE